MKKRIQTGILIAKLIFLRREMGFDECLIAPWNSGLNQLMRWNGWSYYEAKGVVLKYLEIY